MATAFLLFVFSIIDCARLFESWTAVQHASREGARVAVTGSSTCTINNVVYSTRPDCIINTVKNQTTGLLGAGINASSSSLTIDCQSWAYSSGAGTFTPRNDSGPCTDSNAGSQCDAMEVKVVYTHKFVSPILSWLRPSGVDLVGRQRMINEPFGICAS